MRIKVLYLGGSRSQTGCSSEDLELPGGCTVAQVALEVQRRHPKLAPLLSAVRWARNFEFAALSDAVADGDEVAVLPPVSGGSGRAELTTAAIDPQALVARVHDRGMGATVLFVGTVRDHARGRGVERLEYEAYAPMAERQLERIAEACMAERPGSDVAVTHRYGRLEVGEISVAIAASSAHRDDAFFVCRQMIERIKQDVPIWKRELTSDGETWVGWGGG